MEIVELRVHGVHGTSPGNMLGVPSGGVGQVAGDNLTGVYRATTPLPQRELDGTGVSVEAYSWGALTSGVSGFFGWIKRALWLLLLPFALANLSYWARLRMAEDSSVARWGARATRMGAILLTIFMILTPAFIGVDLIAWQCYRGGSPGCAALPGFLDFLSRLEPEQRLALGSLVPLAVLGLLWFLSYQTLERYEEVHERSYDDDVPLGDVLRHPRMWSGKARTKQLQRIHLTAGLATVVCFTGIHVLRRADNHPPIFAVTVALAAGLAVIAVLWTCIMHPDDIDYFQTMDHPMVRWRRAHISPRLRTFVRELVPEQLVRLTLLVTAVHLAALFLVPVDLDDSGDFYGHNLWYIGVFVLLTAVHLSVFLGGRMRSTVAIFVVVIVFVLAGVVIAANAGHVPQGRAGWVLWIGVGLLGAALPIWHYRQGKGHAAVAWNGAGASVFLAAAGWVGLLFTTGVITVTADFLNGDAHGVDDLVSHSSVKAREAAEGVVQQADELAQFTAAGDVTAKDAVIRVAGDGTLEIRSGSVQMESLYQDSEQTSGALKDLARALDSTRVDDALVELPQPWLAVQDSCLRAPDNDKLDCSAEDSDFVPAGTLPLPSKLLAVHADDGKVTLGVSKPPQMPLVLPQVLIWSPIAQLVWLIAILGFLVLAITIFRKSGPAIERLVDEDAAIPERDRGAAKRARRNAALAHRAERLLDGIGAITAAIALAVIAAAASGRAPWDVLPWTRNIATLSMYVAAGLCFGLVFLASQFRRSEEARKGVGVLWDLTTFWPRAAHPLAPPCYAERVVPEIRTRINWVMRTSVEPDLAGGREDNQLVLSGHSQGSLIVAAVASRLSRKDLGRIKVITYGSQIRALYGRVFPSVLGPHAIGYQPTPGPTELGDAYPDAPTGLYPSPPYVVPPAAPDLADDDWAQLPLFDRVFTAGGEWVNLFRRSDPLGFRVFSDTDEAPDHYVPEVPPRIVGDPGPRLMTHGFYQHTPTYRTIVASWTPEDVVPDPVGTQDLPLLPPG